MFSWGSWSKHPEKTTWKQKSNTYITRTHMKGADDLSWKTPPTKKRAPCNKRDGWLTNFWNGLPILVGGWTNPFEKICSSNWIIFPKVRGEHKKYLSCHQLDYRLVTVHWECGGEVHGSDLECCSRNSSKTSYQSRWKFLEDAGFGRICMISHSAISDHDMKKFKLHPSQTTNYVIPQKIKGWPFDWLVYISCQHGYQVTFWRKMTTSIDSVYWKYSTGRKE